MACPHSLFVAQGGGSCMSRCSRLGLRHFTATLIDKTQMFLSFCVCIFLSCSFPYFGVTWPNLGVPGASLGVICCPFWCHLASLRCVSSIRKSLEMSRASQSLWGSMWCLLDPPTAQAPFTHANNLFQNSSWDLRATLLHPPFSLARGGKYKRRSEI
jgi:hypothetical protein